MKKVATPTYNYAFNEKNGEFYRWGKTFEDNPEYSPIGLEILDIEVSTVCSKGCHFCYKSNTGTGFNMLLSTFKSIVENLPTLTQIAFGIGDIDANPDLFKMFEHCRNNSIVPNVTINGTRMCDECYDKLAEYCGAVAVSHYNDDECFNAVKELTDRGMTQVNIHQLLSEEVFEQAMDLLYAYKNDNRLSKLNAIVFLSLKQKGRGENSTIMSPKNFKTVVDYCFDNGIPFGFDSCSAYKFLKLIKGREDYNKIEQLVEPCESGLFSGYVNTYGKFLPCCFSEGEVGFEYDLTEPLDFLQDVWYDSKMVEWRKNLLACQRQCPIYNV